MLAPIHLLHPEFSSHMCQIFFFYLNISLLSFYCYYAQTDCGPGAIKKHFFLVRITFWIFEQA